MKSPYVHLKLIYCDIFCKTQRLLSEKRKSCEYYFEKNIVKTLIILEINKLSLV